MDPQERQRVTNNLAAQVQADTAEREQRYNEAVAGWAIVGSAVIWAAFLLWEDFRDRLMRDGLWWVPLAATLMIAVAAMFLSKKGHPPSSG